MDWKQTAAKLAALGLPVLGKAVGTLVGGQIPIFGNMIEGAGENIGRAAAQMIADALGVEPTPEAINTAIEKKPTTEVIEALQAKEVEAAGKWPALAQIAQAEEETARTQITTTAESMKAEVLAASEMPESKLRTFVQFVNAVWRPMFAMELLAECAFFFFSFTALLIGALVKNDTFDIDAMIKLMPLAVTLLLPYMAARFGLLGYHMNLRTREKEAVTEAVTDAPKPVSLNEIKALLKASGVKIK